MELKTAWMPFGPASREQPPARPFEVGHDSFVVHFVNRPGSRCPVVHHSHVLCEPRGNVLDGVRPADASEARQPARDCDVAKVAAAVDDRGMGKQGGNETQMNVVVGHLVDDPRGFAAVELASERSCPSASGATVSLVRPAMQEAGGSPPWSSKLGMASKSCLARASSPAPCTWGWLARICSTSVVPDRGSPTTNTGAFPLAGTQSLAKKPWSSPAIKSEMSCSCARDGKHASVWRARHEPVDWPLEPSGRPASNPRERPTRPPTEEQARSGRVKSA